MDAKNQQFLDRLAIIGRDGRKPLDEFLRLAGQSGEADLRAVRKFLFDLYCRIYGIDPESEAGAGVRFKFLQDLARGTSVHEVTTLFIGNLLLAEQVHSAQHASQEGPALRSLAERARHAIDEGHAAHLTLQSLAADLAVSKEHLSRVFKKRFGLTVTEYVHQVRIAHARVLMAEGRLSLKQVCYETGYQSYNDFYRNFRKVTGMSPKEYDPALDPPPATPPAAP